MIYEDQEYFLSLFNQQQNSNMTSVGAVSYFSIKISKAAEIKAEGNTLFKKHDYENARNKYQEALQLLQPSAFYGASEVECHQLAELSSALLFNVGTCFFNMSKWKDAVAIYNEALTVNPNYVKAYYKRAMAQFEQMNYEESMTDIKKAYGLDPNNSDIRDGYEKIRVKYNDQLKKDNQKRKEMSSAIFSPKKKEKEKPEKKQQNKSNWWILPLVPLAAVAIYQGVKYFRS